MTIEPEIRKLTRDDHAASEQLSAEAFGRPPNPQGTPRPGATYYGAYLDGTLAAKTTARDYRSHFHGSTVPTCGIGSVTVAAEHRGSGLVRRLLGHAMERARDGGAVVSGLFPTATGIYRSAGYEPITELGELTFATADLDTAVAAPTDPGADHPGPTVRRAAVADAPAIRDCYDRWGAAQNGPLTRRGVSFPADDAELLAAGTTVFVVEADEPAGAVDGYCLWQRGEGFGPEATMTVLDLIALSPAAEAALWRTIGSFAMVAGRTAVRSSGPDASRWVRRAGQPAPGRSLPYNLAVLDVPAAVAALPAPPLVAEFELVVRGRHALASVPGRYRLRADATGVAADRIGEADDTATAAPILSPGGLAAWWASAAGPAELRLAGLLRGPTDHDGILDALVPRRPVRILDHF